uniref:LRRCT domain-containing protein n=1 Tax=Amblyomma maculatum TaxID=34609 RepID=G3MS37_AMBMU
MRGVVGVTVLTLCLALGARCEPKCEDTTRRHALVPEFTCSGFSSPGDFQKHFKHDTKTGRDLWFTLKDSKLEYIPAGFLGEHQASMLEFSNVTLGTFLEPDSNRSLFSGLEPSLKRVTFTQGSSLPRTWATLRPLGRLEELVFFEMTGLNLTRDFNELPAGLRKVVIVRTGVGTVEDDWMSSLLNLENVRIQSSTLDKFSRGMLPRPAPRLRKLTIGDSSLMSLPEDFGQDFPVLTQVNLRQNLISSFDERSLSPLRNSNKTTVVLSGNPVHCDCKVAFLLSYPDSWTYPECDSPEELKGVALRELTAEKLGCTGASEEP